MRIGAARVSWIRGLRGRRVRTARVVVFTAVVGLAWLGAWGQVCNSIPDQTITIGGPGVGLPTDTCDVTPWGIQEVQRGDTVRFKNDTGSSVTVEVEAGLFHGGADSNFTVAPQSEACYDVLPGAELDRAYWFNVSCQPRTGEARPRIIVRPPPQERQE